MKGGSEVCVKCWKSFVLDVSGLRNFIARTEWDREELCWASWLRLPRLILGDEKTSCTQSNCKIRVRL